MAAVVALIVLLAFALGFRFYAAFVGRSIFEDDENLSTPAHVHADGRDFVPTRKFVLFGHHFTSIAGAAPIIGPCVAAYWGWLPALVWVVLGTIFMGAVHDFGALVVSVREGGRSIADITGGVISARVRMMFLCFVMVLSWLVLAVFAMAIAGMFAAVPSSVLPVNVAILVALAVGWLIHVKGVRPLVPSLVALVILYAFVWIGTEIPIDLTASRAHGGLGLSADEAVFTWILLLFGYSAIASLLPVWLLLQPRDFVNSHQLLVGLSLLFVGLFIAHPDFDAPAIRAESEGAPPLFPVLFVTIACGAISGFHGLVSSGTTSKQLNHMRDARAIGYGSMLGEGALALAATMAAVAGIGLVGGTELVAQGAVDDLSWAVYYDSWAHAGANKATAFVLGGGAFLQQLGLSAEIAQTMMAVMVISFASTTLDTATRIERFIVSEVGEAAKVKVLQRPWVATCIAVVPGIFLATWTVDGRQAGWLLWPIFGASNQMIAALTLLVLALYFWKRDRPVLPLVIPMVLVMGIAFASLAMNAKIFMQVENWTLMAITLVLLSLMVWMAVEGLTVFVRLRRERAAKGKRLLER